MATARVSLVQMGRIEISLVVSSDDSGEALRANQIAHELATARDKIRMAVLIPLAMPVGAQTVEQPKQSSPAASATEPATARASGSPAAAPPAAAAAEPRRTAAAPRAPPGKDRLPEWRISRARKAGESAGEKLRGEIGAVPRTPEPEGPMPAPRYYCVLRSSDESKPAIYTSWKITADHVSDPREPSGLGAATVFHAFPSRAEVRAYCQAAQVAEPEPEDIFTTADPAA